MPTYAQAADVEAYIEGWVTGDPDELDRDLERAERDVDSVLGPIPIAVNSTTGLKLDPTILTDWEAAALARAVCAQFEYRYHQGAATLAAGRVTKTEKGPEFEVTYQDAPASAGGGPLLIGSRVRIELEPIRHLRRLRARLTP